MDSESDWDSYSGEAPDLGDVSVSMRAESVKQPPKNIPRPPSAEKSSSQTVNKIPLRKASNEIRNTPRVAEQYRNMSNKGRLQGVTTFRDSGEIAVGKSDAASSNGRNTPVSPEPSNFQEIELKETPIRDNVYPEKKKSLLKDSNENLPYTEFEASNMSPRKAEPPPKNQAMRKAHLEYVTKSPEPEPSNLKHQRKSFDSEAQPEHGIMKKESRKPHKKSKKHSKISRHSVIINENADDYYDSEDTQKDVTWHDHHQEAKQVKEATSRDIVLKSPDQTLMLEERYEYEDAVRDYHSIYIENQAKMPIIANKLESVTRRGIQEFFGSLQIIVDFVVIFIVESLRFILRQFGRKLIGGLLTAFGDFLTKPLFSSLFNSIIQPFFVLTWNLLYGIPKLLEPILLLTRELFSQVSLLLGSFRLVQVNWKSESRLQSI